MEIQFNHVLFSEWVKSSFFLSFFCFWSLSIVSLNSCFFLFVLIFSTVYNCCQWIIGLIEVTLPLPELIPGWVCFTFIVTYSLYYFTFKYTMSLHNQFSHLDLGWIPGPAIYYNVTSNFWFLESFYVK